MKKITKIIGAVAAAALAVVAFAGCTQQHLSMTYPNYSFPLDTVITADTNTAAVQVTKTATTNAYSKYTITFNSLGADIGNKFVVAGATIGSTSSNMGDNWNVTEAAITDTGLVSTVDDNGSVTFTFYGTSPSWASKNSAMFKICQYGTWDSPLFCTNGDNGYIENSAGYDVVVVIDASQF